MAAYAVGSELRRMARGKLSGLEECEGGTRVVFGSQEVIISSEPQLHCLMCKDKLIGSNIYVSRDVRDRTDWYLRVEDGRMAGTTYAHEQGTLQVITRSKADGSQRMHYKRK